MELIRGYTDTILENALVRTEKGPLLKSANFFSFKNVVVDTNVNENIRLPFKYRQSCNSLGCQRFSTLNPFTLHKRGENPVLADFEEPPFENE